jgi:hypothetical protein
VSRARRLGAAGGLALLTAVVAAAVAGCDSSTSAAAQPPTARMELTGHPAVQSVVLTPLGASRVGVRTSAAGIALVGTQGAFTVVPYSALLYEPDGATAVYVNTGPLVYTRYYVSVVSINGNQVYLKIGSLPAAATVVTVGAEELLGVQNGVGVQT